MKNRITLFVAMGLVLFVAMGCSLGSFMGSDDTATKDSTSKSADTSSDSTSRDNPTEKEPSGEIVKVGIPECDELATYLNDNSEAIGNENLVVRGIVEMYKQTIFSSLRDSVKDMDDEQKKTMGENCSKALENVKKQMKN